MVSLSLPFEVLSSSSVDGESLALSSVTSKSSDPSEMTTFTNLVEYDDEEEVEAKTEKHGNNHHKYDRIKSTRQTIDEEEATADEFDEEVDEETQEEEEPHDNDTDVETSSFSDKSSKVRRSAGCILKRRCCRSVLTTVVIAAVIVVTIIFVPRSKRTKQAKTPQPSDWEDVETKAGENDEELPFSDESLGDDLLHHPNEAFGPPRSPPPPRFNATLPSFGRSVRAPYPSCTALRDHIRSALQQLANAVIDANVQRTCTFYDPPWEETHDTSRGTMEYQVIYNEDGTSHNQGGQPPPDAGTSALTGGGRQEDEDSSSDLGRIETSGYETNNQVHGVDEADIVKSNGEYVFVAYGAELVMLNLDGTELDRVTVPQPMKETIQQETKPQGMDTNHESNQKEEGTTRAKQQQHLLQVPRDEAAAAAAAKSQEESNQNKTNASSNGLQQFAVPVGTIQSLLLDSQSKSVVAMVQYEDLNPLSWNLSGNKGVVSAEKTSAFLYKFGKTVVEDLFSDDLATQEQHEDDAPEDMQQVEPTPVDTTQSNEESADQEEVVLDGLEVDAQQDESDPEETAQQQPVPGALPDGLDIDAHHAEQEESKEEDLQRTKPKPLPDGLDIDAHHAEQEGSTEQQQQEQEQDDPVEVPITEEEALAAEEELQQQQQQAQSSQEEPPPTKPTTAKLELVGSVNVSGRYTTARLMQGSNVHLVTQVLIRTNGINERVWRCTQEFEGMSDEAYEERAFEVASEIVDEYVDDILEGLDIVIVEEEEEEEEEQESVGEDANSNTAANETNETSNRNGKKDKAVGGVGVASDCSHIMQISSMTNHGGPIMQQSDAGEGEETQKESQIASDPGLVLTQGEGVIRSFIQISSFDVSKGALLQEDDVEKAGAFTPVNRAEVYANNDMFVIAARGHRLDTDEEQEAEIAGDDEQEEESPGDEERDEPRESWSEYTFLMSFLLERNGGKNGGPAAIQSAIGAVRGYLQNSFSMDYYEGYLRVATTNSAKWVANPDLQDGAIHYERVEDSSSQITKLQLLNAEEIVQVGQLKNVGVSERIFGARFIRNRAYIVTFDVEDPLLVVDLEPEAPVVLGEVDVSGFASYLHPIRDDEGNEAYLLTVGQEADPLNNNPSGLKISLFNVSNPAAPEEIQNYVERSFGGSDAHSVAQSDHHSFRYIDSARKLILPLSVRSNSDIPTGSEFDGFAVYDVEPETGISPAGEVTHAAGHVIQDFEVTTESGRYCFSPAWLPPRSMVVNEGQDLITFKGHSIQMNAYLLNESFLDNEGLLWTVALDDNRDSETDICFEYFFGSE